MDAQQQLQMLLQSPSEVASDLISTINTQSSRTDVRTFVKLFLDLIRAEGGQVLTAATETQYSDQFPGLNSPSGFPALGAALADCPKQQEPKKLKPKKRVRPTAVKKADSAPQGSIERVPDTADFPSLSAAPPNQLIARQPRADPRPAANSSVPPKPNPFSQAPWGAASPERASPAPQLRVITCRDPDALMHVARVHAAVVNCHWLVCGRLSAELMLLVQLLLAESKKKAGHAKGQLLQSPSDCAHYAACCLADLGHWVIKLGRRAAQALCDSTPFCSRCPDLADVLREDLQQQSRGQSPRSRTGVGSSLDLSYFTVPFHTVVDSRHAFRSPTDSKLYNNREKLRDKLVLILELHSSLLSEHQQGMDPVRDAVREFMLELDPLNTAWFAGHFVDQALQHGLAHHDGAAIAAMNLQGTTAVDSDKISKLHRRFSSRHNHTASIKPVRAGEAAGSATSSTKLFEMKHPDDTFELFLSIADSHVLSVHLVTQLAGRISVLTDSSNDSMSELANLFTERTLKLKRLAKLLGFILFSPFWPEPDSESPALREGRNLTISQLSTVLPPVDVLAMLQRAIGERTVVLVVPWIVELLKMQRDSVTRSSLYYTRVYAALRQLYHSTHQEQVKLHKHRASAVAMVVLSEIEALFDFLMLSLHSSGPQPPPPAQSPSMPATPTPSMPPTDPPQSPALQPRSSTPPRTPTLPALFAESPPGTPIREAAGAPPSPVVFGAPPQTPTGLTPGRRGLHEVVDQSDGLVTELYIEYCSPYLDELRRLLCKSSSTKLTRQNSARLRPHAAAKTQQPEKPHGAHLRLLSNALRQYPQLRRLVDFVAESCTENACVASFQVVDRLVSGLSQRLRFIEGLAAGGLIKSPHEISMFQAVAAAAEKCVAKIASKAAAKDSSASIVEAVRLLGPPHTPQQLLQAVSDMAVEHATLASAERMEASAQQNVQLQLIPRLKKMARARVDTCLVTEERPAEQLMSLGEAALELHTHCLKRLHAAVGERIKDSDLKPLGKVLNQAAALLHSLPNGEPPAWIASAAPLLHEVGLMSLWHWPHNHAELATSAGSTAQGNMEWQEVLSSLISCWHVLYGFDSRHILQLLEQIKTHAAAQLNLYGSEKSHGGGLVAWAALCIRLVEEGLVELVRVEVMWLEVLQNVVTGSELLRVQVVRCVEWIVNHFGLKQLVGAAGSHCQTLGCMRLAAELVYLSDKYAINSKLVGFMIL